MFDAHMEMIHHKKENFRTIAWGQKNRKGPLDKMYYEFSSDGIMFYTENQWNSKSGSKLVLDTVYEMVQSYVGSINRNHPSFTDFAEDMRIELKQLSGNRDEDIVETLMIVNKLTVKHGLVAVS